MINGRVKPELEKEASLFAMLLLVPKQFLKEDMANGLDLSDNDTLTKLAKKYDVPLTMMAYRIAYFIKRKQ